MLEKFPIFQLPLSGFKPSYWIRLSLFFLLLFYSSDSPTIPQLVNAQPAFSTADAKAMAMNKIMAMEEISGGPLNVTLSRKSGLATFLATKPGKEIPIPSPAFGNAKERARSFLKEYGETFGLHDPSEYRIMTDRGPDEYGREPGL